MKRLLVFATVLSFLAPGLLAAAPGDQPMTKPAFGQQPVGKPPSSGKPPGTRPPSHRPPSHRPPHHRPPVHRPPINRPPINRPPVHRPPIHHRPPPGWQKPRADQWFWRGRWVNRVRMAAFIYPPGYRYRYWYVGDVLPALFLGSQYYYDDVGPLGLEVPPPGYRWVRYGSDLLLVNLRTGAVEQVAYGVFY
jgi:Ni/Co efflux regulator RcnB